MPTIKIYRTSGHANRFRNIQLYLDNNKIGDLADGQSMEVEAERGKHKLIAKIDWTTSNEIDFEIAETKLVFKLTGTNPFLALYYITFGRKNYLKLEKVRNASADTP